MLMTKMLNFFKKKKKRNLVTGSLLLVSAIFAGLPGLVNLVKGFQILDYSNVYFINIAIQLVIFSFILMLPSLVLVFTSYLIWERHSLGWKLSFVVSAFSLLIALAIPSSLYFTLPIVLLSFTAAILESRLLRGSEKTRDSPVTIENLVKFALRLSVIIGISILFLLVIFIVVMALPFLSTQLFTSSNFIPSRLTSEPQSIPLFRPVGGVLTSTTGSLAAVGICELVAIPLGVGAAIYLAEYSKQSKLTSIIRFFIETLAGAPSVIVALIGYSIFVVTLGWGVSVYGAAIALSFMALPWNIRIAEESLRSVPKAYKDGAFALGATRWQTARHISLYAGLPGIITGILLGIGAVVGETLVLLLGFSYGASYFFAYPIKSLFQLHGGFPSLPVTIYSIASTDNALFGTSNPYSVGLRYSLALSGGFVLIVIYLALCIGALLLRNSLNKKIRGF